MKNKQLWEVELQNEIQANRETMDKTYRENMEMMLKYLDNNPGVTVDQLYESSGLSEWEFHHLMTRLLEEKQVEADDGQYYQYGVKELEEEDEE